MRLPSSGHTLVLRMNCPKCGLEQPEGAQYCMRCGKELLSETAGAPSDTLYCAFHPKTPTQLSCGRCGKPICTKCVVLGPAGPRCRECSRQNIPLRPSAIAYEAKRGFMGLFRGGYSLWIWIVVAGMIFSAIRGCAEFSRPHRLEVPVDQGSDARQTPRDAPDGSQ